MRLGHKACIVTGGGSGAGCASNESRFAMGSILTLDGGWAATERPKESRAWTVWQASGR